MEKWRSRNPISAAFADHSGWDVHLESGVVHTVIDGVPVTVIGSPAGNGSAGVIIGVGAQAERTLANRFDDDPGDPFELDGWTGVAGPGSGVLEGFGSGPALYGQVVDAANALVARVRES